MNPLPTVRRFRCRAGSSTRRGFRGLGWLAAAGGFRQRVVHVGYVDPSVGVGTGRFHVRQQPADRVDGLADGVCRSGFHPPVGPVDPDVYLPPDRRRLRLTHSAVRGAAWW